MQSKRVVALDCYNRGLTPQKVPLVIDNAVAEFLESVGLPVFWQSQAPFYAAELQVLRAVDCCLREETACFGGMEDRVENMLAEIIQVTAEQQMTQAERAEFFPIWEQLDEATQLFVLNGYNDLPPKDCKMRKRPRAVATHGAGPKLN